MEDLVVSYGVNSTITEGSIAKSLFFFSLPVLLGNVLQSLNGSINAIWIGRFLGQSAFAATSNANNVMFFLLSSIFGIGMASTILIGQSVGAKNIEQAKRVVGASALFFLFLSLGVAVIGWTLSPAILRAMHTPPDAQEYAVEYLRIIFIGIPFMYGYNFLMMVLRGAGDAKTPFYFLILSSILDALLNPVFIFGLGPAPKMGIAGSATATAIAQVVSFACLVLFLYHKKHFLRLTRADMHYVRFDRQILGSLIKKGLPMGFQMIVVSSSGLALINLVNSFGSVATAAYGAAMQLSSYVQMPAMAIGGAVSTLAAQNIGAGNWERVNKTALWGVLFNFVMTGTLVSIIYLFNRDALSLFLKGSNALDIGMRINAITLWGFVLFGITFVVSGVVRSTGSVAIPLLITFIALWCVRIPFSYVLGHKYGIDMLWWGFPTGFILSTVLAVAYYIWGNWRNATMMRAPQAQKA